MNIFPTTREDRLRFVVTALGAYIIAVPLVGMFSKFWAERSGWNDFGRWSYGAQYVLEKEEARRFLILEYGYIGCILALLLILPALKDKRIRTSALAFVTIGIILLGLLIYPMTQVPKTK